MTGYHRPMGLATDLGMRPLIACCNLGRGGLYRRTSNPQQPKTLPVRIPWLAMPERRRRRYSKRTALLSHSC